MRLARFPIAYEIFDIRLLLKQMEAILSRLLDDGA